MSVTSLLLLAALALPLEEDPSFQEGLRLVEQFDYERAVFRFREAARVEGRDAKDRAQVLLHLGTAYAELGESDTAVLTFEEALGADFASELPADASPRIQELMSRARARLAAGPSARGGEGPAGGGSVAAVEEPASGPWRVLGVGAAGGGAAVALAGGALWGVGLWLRAEAQREHYQSDAAAARGPAIASQIAGQVLVGGGALVLLAGAGILLAGVM